MVNPYFYGWVQSSASSHTVLPDPVGEGTINGQTVEICTVWMSS
jgi:hypothetical protein